MRTGGGSEAPRLMDRKFTRGAKDDDNDGPQEPQGDPGRKTRQKKHLTRPSEGGQQTGRRGREVDALLGCGVDEEWTEMGNPK